MDLKTKYIFTMTQKEYDIVYEFLDLLCEEVDNINEGDLALDNSDIYAIQMYFKENTVIKDKEW